MHPARTSRSRRASRACLHALVFAAVLLPVAYAHAQAAPEAEVTGAAVAKALEAAAPAKAIALAEALADRGAQSPELAYHRGLAYAQRVATPEEASGDAGQAIAGFLEAEALGAAGDVAARAEAGLLAVRSHLARKRSSAGLASAVEPSPGLVRATLLAVPVSGWLAIATLLGFASAAVAIASWRAEREHRAGRVAAAGILIALTGVFSLASAGAEAVRRDEAIAVVIAPQAPLLEAGTGALASDEALPEGLAVRVRAGDGSTLTLADRLDRALRRDQVRVVAAP
jgi:hypothetical protein